MAHSNWQEGATAARAGHPITACPYPASEWASVTWTNGWTTATHNMAVEAAKSSTPAAAAPVDDDLFGDDNSDLF